MRKYTRFVWLALLYAQFVCETAACLQSETAVLHHREERVRLGDADLLPQREFLVLSPADVMTTKRNRSCRRCLQIKEDDSSVPVGEGDVADPPVDDVDLPLRPTDPDVTTMMPPPPPARAMTNPSSQLLAPPGDINEEDGKGGLAAAGKVGISAGVGAAVGVGVLVAGVLYYLKPDMFLCCKTCVRVQVFQHTNHASKP